MATLIINQLSIEHPVNEDLFVDMDSSGIFIAHSCNKQGLCKECVIKIESGAEFLNSPTLQEKHLKAPYRLACQTKIINENAMVVCTTLKNDSMVVVEQSYNISQDDNIYELDPEARRNDDGKIYLNEKVIALKPGPVFGLSVDIGTTTVVCQLVDLQTGIVQKVNSFENPQRMAGSNVLSRIYYDTQKKKGQLKRILDKYLSDAIVKLTEDHQHILELCIGGNTTMRDLFFGLDVSTIGVSPFRSITEQEATFDSTENNTALECPGKKMKLPVHPEARIFSLPLIGNLIGSDITSGLAAVSFHRKKDWHVFIDIGTNTEIVVGNKDIAYAASSPSGPAFEGRGITFGMPAMKGAIEKVRIKENRNELSIIGIGKAKGICGSGLIDVLGELKKTNKINVMGRFEEEAADDEKFYLDHEQHIFITENDINQLAQAKGANAAALQLLLNKCDLQADDIKKYYLSGGFGKHIDLDSAKSIGLLPDVPNDKFVRIGNSCIEGATRVLLNKKLREEITGYTKKIITMQLESEQMFFEHFVNGCLFQPMDMDLE